MPRYTYKCSGCGQIADDDVPVADRDMPHVCGECDGEMTRVFSAPTVTKMLSAGKRKHR